MLVFNTLYVLVNHYTINGYEIFRRFQIQTFEVIMKIYFKTESQ